VYEPSGASAGTSASSAATGANGVANGEPARKGFEYAIFEAVFIELIVVAPCCS
jgi:hypothetical protein